MALERIEVRRPELAERDEPVVEVLQRPWLDSVDAALCIHGRLDEAGLAQHAQVLGHRRLRQAELPFDFTDRPLGREQQAENRAAIRFRDDGEDGVHGRIYTD